jgi:hypothetical protein
MPTLGEILMAGAAMAAPIIGFLYVFHRQNLKRFDSFFNLLSQFPLHRHVNGRVWYPAGVRPNNVTEKDDDGK